MSRFEQSVMRAVVLGDLPAMKINQHLGLWNEEVSADDEAILIAPCTRIDRREGDMMLLATKESLVLHKVPWFRQLKRHLVLPRSSLRAVSWGPHPKYVQSVVLKLTTPDSTVELALPAPQPNQMRAVDEALEACFGEQPSR